DGAAGGSLKSTAGLFERFGPERVRDTPISEQAIVGTAFGAAVMGLRPVAEIMFADFAGVCFDQIANQVAKHRYMTGGQVTVPLTIRMASGAGLGLAAHGTSVAVIDPRTLVPFDDETVVHSLRTTSRLVVVQEAPEAGSWGASLISRITRRHWELLDAPPVLVATPDTPVPYAGNLE